MRGEFNHTEFKRVTVQNLIQSMSYSALFISLFNLNSFFISTV